jgi:ATP-binding cassette subfamily F protein 3
LDIQSKEVLKSALINYEGTFIVVSHDREFLDGLTNRIWDIYDKTLKIHHYDVKEYLEKKLNVGSMNVDNDSKPKVEEVKTTVVEKEKPETKLSFEEQKELKRKKNALQNSIKKSEELINELEGKLKILDAELVEVDYNDKEKSGKLLNEYQEVKSKLDRTMYTWETAIEELEELI